MVDNALQRVAGWAAYLSGAAHVAATLTAIGLLLTGEPFRTMNDLALVAFAVALLPVAFVLYRAHQPDSPKRALLATLLGLTGVFALVSFSLLLISGAIAFEQYPGVFFVANGLIGVWLIATGLLARAKPNLPRRLSVLTVAAGVSQLLYVPAVILVPVWAVGLGRYLISDTRLAAPARSD